VVVGSQIGFQLGSPANPRTPVESGLWDFLLLRRSRAARLDLAGQRLTSEMVHGPELGLTLWNARGALGAVFIPKAPWWWRRWISQVSGVM